MNAAAGLALLAGAILVWPGATSGRLAGLLGPTKESLKRRLSPPARHALLALAAGLALLFLIGAWWGAGGAAGVWWLLRRSRRPRAPDVAERLRLAGTLDLLAACLRAGLPVPTALAAVADLAPTGAADALRSASGLLALGAGPEEAWAPVRARPELGELAVAAIRTARAGTVFAAAAAELAGRLRDDLAVGAEERAERAGVVLALPVGLCFLPAFLCLGVLPVVLGLAAGLGPLLR